MLFCSVEHQQHRGGVNQRAGIAQGAVEVGQQQAQSQYRHTEKIDMFRFVLLPQRRAEKHNQYIDVQYVAQGSETIWFTPLTEANVETENLAEENDVIFYDDPKEKNCAVLNAGDFAIFFPWELHRPNCANGCCGEGEITHVQKIVVKVEA